MTNKVLEDEDDDIEIDEFGDVVPPHLRKNNTNNNNKKKNSKCSKKRSYDVHEVEKKEFDKKEIKVEIEENCKDDGWTTDF